MPQILAIARPGDILAHAYSAMPDGVLGDDERPSPLLLDAVARGVLLDIGFGINFSYGTARRMIAAGLFPQLISSDVHGRFDRMHDDGALDYSLAGAFARMVALGMPFMAALAAVTLNPARVLGDETEIGTLAIGSLADVSVLAERIEDWPLADSARRGAGSPAALDPAPGVARRPADRPLATPGARCGEAGGTGCGVSAAIAPLAARLLAGAQRARQRA